MNDLDLGREERPKKAKGGAAFIAFLVGLAVGVAGTVLVPRYLGSYLPAGLGGGGETVEGAVLGKRQEEGRLLLTVNARQGAVLATFSERVAEIDLLVDVGDTVTLGVSSYEPFIDDPAFRGIRKAGPTPTARQPVGAAAEGSAEEAEQGAGAEDTGAAADTAGAETSDREPGGDLESPPGGSGGVEEASPGDTVRP